MPDSFKNAVIRGLAVLSRANEWICVAARNLAGGLMMAMTAIVLAQILFRYVLNDSLIWTEEVSKTMMVWTAFLVAPWAYRHGANVGIEMCIESVGMVERGFSIRAASMPVQVGWFFGVMPLAFAMILLVGIELVLRDLLGLAYSGDDFSVPGAGMPMEGE